MKIDKKWKKLHKLLLCPFMIIFLIACVLVGNKVIVNADSLIVTDFATEDYIPVALANPDKVSFLTNNTISAVFAGNDVVSWSSDISNLDLDNLGDDMELTGNGDLLSDPPYKFTRRYNLGTSADASVYNHTHYQQNGRFILTLGSRIGGNNSQFFEYVPSEIIFEKSDFIIKKADLMTCNITNYGVFPFIQFTNDAGEGIHNGLFIDGISYYFEINYSFLGTSGTWYPDNTLSVSRNLTSTYNYAVYLSPTDWANGFGITSLSDNTKIYIDNWRLGIQFTEQFDSEDDALAYMLYTFPLIPNASHPDVTSFDLDYSDENFGSNYLTDLVNSVVGEELQNNFTNWLLVGANNFFSFELIPGVSLFTILAICLAIPLLIWILKLIMGG